MWSGMRHLGLIHFNIQKILQPTSVVVFHLTYYTPSPTPFPTNHLINNFNNISMLRKSLRHN
jgi:hypothetical protein